MKISDELPYKNFSRSMTEKGLLTHNGCYPIKWDKKRPDYGATIKKRIYRSYFLTLKKGSFKERTLILDEFCATCGYHRKHAIRLLQKYRRFVNPKVKKRGRSPVYHLTLILKPLKKIWLAVNLPSATIDIQLFFSYT